MSLSLAERQKRHRQKKEYEKKMYLVPDNLKKFFVLRPKWTQEELDLKIKQINLYFENVKKNNADVRKADNALFECTDYEQAKQLFNGLVVRGLQLNFLPLYADIFLNGIFTEKILIATAKRLRKKLTVNQAQWLISFLKGEK